MHNFTVSLCIVAYNEEDYLSFLFENILKQTYPKSLTEIVLVIHLILVRLERLNRRG